MMMMVISGVRVLISPAGLAFITAAKVVTRPAIGNSWHSIARRRFSL
jgi:hypothetical protein